MVRLSVASISAHPRLHSFPTRRSSDLSPLVILDCERVRVQFRKLRKALPRVDLHYALKPMPHPAVVQTVIAEGGFLDLATSGEVQLVQRLSVAPERCIHSHPIKREQDIANALQFG